MVTPVHRCAHRAIEIGGDKGHSDMSWTKVRPTGEVDRKIDVHLFAQADDVHLCVG